MVKLLCDRCGRIGLRFQRLRYESGWVTHECDTCADGPMLHEINGGYLHPDIRRGNHYLSNEARFIESHMKIHMPYKNWYPLRNEDLAERYGREAMMGRMV